MWIESLSLSLLFSLCLSLGIEDVDVGQCQAGIGLNGECPGDLLYKEEFCYEPSCVMEILKKESKKGEEKDGDYLKKKKEEEQKKKKKEEEERKRKELEEQTKKAKVKPPCGREHQMCPLWVRAGFCKNTAYSESAKLQHCGRGCDLCKY